MGSGTMTASSILKGAHVSTCDDRRDPAMGQMAMGHFRDGKLVDL